MALTSYREKIERHACQGERHGAIPAHNESQKTEEQLEHAEKATLTTIGSRTPDQRYICGRLTAPSPTNFHAGRTHPTDSLCARLLSDNCL